MDGRIRGASVTWQDKEGNKRYTTEIVASSVQFLSPRGESGGSSGGPKAAPGGGIGGGNKYGDDGIPF